MGTYDSIHDNVVGLISTSKYANDSKSYYRDTAYLHHSGSTYNEGRVHASTFIVADDEVCIQVVTWHSTRSDDAEGIRRVLDTNLFLNREQLLALKTAVDDAIIHLTQDPANAST